MSGIVYCPDANQNIYRPPLYLVKDFLAAFARKYQEHGGRIDPDPVITSGIHNGAGAVKNLVEKTLSAHKQYPQLMFFILRDQTIDYYSQIKSAADCVYGVVSQCVQSSHVMKCNPQYLSNVCMKVNAKLGGTTSQIKVSPASVIHSSLAQLLIDCNSQPFGVAVISRSLP